MFRIVSVLVVLSMFIIGFGGCVNAAPEATDPLDVSHLEGRLAFPVFEDDTYNIYVSNIDGSGRKLLIPEASQPALSSDGSEIAYRSWKADQIGLFSSPIDEIIPWSIQQRALSESGRPAWSPDDQVIVFQSYEESDRLPRIYYTLDDDYLPIRTDKSGKFVDLLGIDPDWMPDGSIVYTEKECEKCGIYITTLSGEVVAQVTDNPADEAPAASPDGKQIAFMSTRDEVWDLYVVNSDGTGLERLTEDAEIDGLPIWAPDGKTLIFVSYRNEKWGIWAIDVETKAMARLFLLGGELDGIIHEGTSRGWTEEKISLAPLPPPPPLRAAGPATNLDTSHLKGKLAFPVFEDETYNIYVSNIDGSDREMLIAEASQPDLKSDGSEIAYRSWKTDGRGMFQTPVDEIIPWNIQQKVHIESGRPKWSPDDTTILFHSYEDAKRDPRIYFTTGDDDVYRPILTDKSGKYVDLIGIDPDWMPDGSIVYTEKECEKCGIFTISLTGGLIGQLTDNPADQAPAVSPDGKKVAFMSTRDDDTWDLYVINSDGTSLARLTDDSAIDGLPTWGPDSNTIIFASNRDGEWGIWAFDLEQYAMGKLFSLGGELDGMIHKESSKGWTEETISWAP